MKKRSALLVSILMLVMLTVFAVACGQRDNIPKLQDYDEADEGITQYIEKLCDNAMEGREGGKKGEAEAALYLARFLQRNGVKPAGDNGTYFQAFDIYEYKPVMEGLRMVMGVTDYSKKRHSENVLGIIEGVSDEIIVLSAHYDHLGIIGNEYYRGANDNASGVAAVMDLVKKLVERGPVNTVLIAFWGSEEKGLWGSQYFCEHPTVPLEKIKAVVNLDTVGNLKSDWQLLGWQDAEGPLAQQIIERLENKGWSINWEKHRGHNSDHWSFAKKKIPGFTLLSPRWLANNHTPLDTIERLNITNIEALTKSLGEIFTDVR
ncbi:MAG TPA: M20/M25/M40 family metallo-hydrolase [Peptococcaceae bacterium]|nr:M20/M25/M40 family metallo-hydrolase [Clostridia bacterium]HOB81783.1 M20/M25/M40 family metallo-hydrolase [Peptococcaceae bacterium]HPZ71908.1 M20/M25/M40 family metallo-hydrolase [Peptococcaceae bacterium]HQD53688.1 M20/M25/M40 family metallo-hydrolase [Peptococcaceae bacterium]